MSQDGFVPWDVEVGRVAPLDWEARVSVESGCGFQWDDLI